MNNFHREPFSYTCGQDVTVHAPFFNKGGKDGTIRRRRYHEEYPQYKMYLVDFGESAGWYAETTLDPQSQLSWDS